MQRKIKNEIFFKKILNLKNYFGNAKKSKISFGNVKKNQNFLLFTFFLAKNIKKCQIQKNRFLSLKCQFKKSYGKFFSLELQRKIKFPLEL